MRTLRFRFRSEGGSAAAEMALILPFLVLLLFGSVELGYYFYNEHQIVKGVRDGARFASRQPFSAIRCNGANPVAVPADVETAIKEVTRTGQLSGGTARVPGWTNATVTITVTCPATAVTTGIYKNETNAPQINVAATISYQSLFDGIGVVDGTYHLNASQQAAVMGL